MLFIDYKQACDSMVRKELWIAMEDLGVSTKLIRLIRSCLQNSKCKIKIIDYISKEFKIKIVLRQGDALSPMFFNIALKSVVRELYDTDVGIRLLNKNINLLAYKDKFKTLAELLIERSKSMAHMVNERKTKYMM